jgi:hypothetical protein
MVIKTKTIIEGKVEWVQPKWDEDPPSHYEIGGDDIQYILNNYDNLTVRITIEIIND